MSLRDVARRVGMRAPSLHTYFASKNAIYDAMYADGALAGTRADLQAAGVHGEPALDLYRALITGLVSLQIANDPGGDRWTRLQDDALEMSGPESDRGARRPEIQPDQCPATFGGRRAAARR